MKCANPACENDPIPAGVKYCCEECRKSANRARKREAYAAFIERNPGYLKAAYERSKTSGGKKKVRCYGCDKFFEVPKPSKRIYCDACVALRNGNKLSSKDGPRKDPVYTEAQLAEIRAAHGGKGEICRNCMRPFIRRYSGQTYCYAPECAKAAKREAMRMGAV